MKSVHIQKAFFAIAAIFALIMLGILVVGCGGEEPPFMENSSLNLDVNADSIDDSCVLASNLTWQVYEGGCFKDFDSTPLHLKSSCT